MKRFYLSLVILIVLSQACSFIQGETAPAASQPSAPLEPILPAATEVQASSEISPPADQPEVQQEGQQAGLQVYLPVDQSTYYNGIPDECWNDPATRKSTLLEDNGFSVFPALQDGAASRPLYFTIVIHIEPQEEYANPERYELDKERLTRMADLVAAHGGRLTIETQRPFITTSQQQGDNILHTWESQGHEIAVHFHENSYVKGKPGSFGSDVPFEEWVTALGGLKDEISGLVDNPVVTWSGGNLYPRIAEVAQAVGLSVNTNYKDPSNQSIDSAYMTVSPWRLTDGETSAERAVHDPNGAVIYIPSGVYPAHCGNAEVTPHPYTTSAFDFVSKALVSSLKAGRIGYINSFYLTIHPGDFGIPRDDEAEFTRWNEWLTKVIDPLVADGRLRWSTASQTATAFIAWEKERSTQLTSTTSPQAYVPSTVPVVSSSTGNQQTSTLLVLPTASLSPADTSQVVNPTAMSIPAEEPDPPEGYISFIINVHDFYNVDKSADSLMRLMDIFEKYGIHGDFYFTAPMVGFFVEQRPDLIERLKNSDHTISYHVRPPHPTYVGFDQRLKGLGAEELDRTLRDYETYRLDLATGDLDRTQPGGYNYIKEVFGRPPVTVSILNGQWRKAAMPIFAELGAQATMIYHETGTDIQQPFKWIDGLLVRPSDFSITRWTTGNLKGEQFWWNMLDTPYAAEYNPAQHLQNELDAWQAGRSPFITVLIHDDNFYSVGATPWKLVYYSDAQRGRPLTPPYNLNALDASQPRSQENQDAIWAAYEELVAYAASHLKVVTSQDIVELARAPQ